MTSPAGLGDRTAAGLVFGASAAVLVVELTALRLLAPYLGLTLETSTLVIGIALVASDRELDLASIQAAMGERGTGWTLVDGAVLNAWVGYSVVLTDDFAPVDQLLEP